MRSLTDEYLCLTEGFSLFLHLSFLSTTFKKNLELIKPMEAKTLLKEVEQDLENSK